MMDGPVLNDGLWYGIDYDPRTSITVVWHIPLTAPSPPLKAGAEVTSRGQSQAMYYYLCVRCICFDERIWSSRISPLYIPNPPTR